MKISNEIRNWFVLFNGTSLYFQARFGNSGVGYKSIGRQYNIPANPDSIEFDEEYIRLNYSHLNKMYQFKLEGDSCIVGDIWEEGEHLDVIACYDLWDDWDEPVPSKVNISGI